MSLKSTSVCYAAACDAWAMRGEDDDSPIELRGHSFEEIRETHRFLTGGARKHRAVIRVQAIVEVKGCERSRELLLDELRRHRRRLESETVLLSFRGRRWEPAPDPKRPSTADRKQIEVERFEFADDFLFISVVPGRPSGRDDSDAEMRQLQLPWSAAGIRAMTRGFLVATLRESANWVDRGHRDYTLGQRAWAAAVRPHLADPRLTHEDRRSMLQIIDADIAPERELLAMIAERRAIRAAARRSIRSHS